MIDWKRFLREPKIAYFSMEIGLSNDIPTYSGGLGVLVGDTIKSAADLKLPMVGEWLVFHDKGSDCCKWRYFLIPDFGCVFHGHFYRVLLKLHHKLKTGRSLSQVLLHGLPEKIRIF
jgi:hypothetical protein